MVHDQRIEYFNKKGPNLGRKAVDFYQYRTADFETAYNMFKESISITKNKSQGPIIIYYFRLTAKMVKEEVAEPSLIVETYDEVSDIIDYNLTKYKGDQRRLESWLNVKGNIENEFEPFATCEDLVSIYTKKFEQNPNDLELLKKITTILEKKDCTEEQLFMDATIQLYKLEPSPESAYLISRMYLKQQNYRDALTYLTEATAMENTDKLADVYYFLAVCNYQIKKYSVARSNAKKALEYNPNYGNAYILIGDMYAASAKNCGDNELTNKVAFWAAVDKYSQAKRVDQEVADVANRRIRDYRKHYPTMETIFFYNLKEGDTYKVGCWINETTTVRAAPQ
jgi:tetratricopeptide (TPR) repeat protein